MIVIVDYGMGNLRSVQKALERVGAPTAISGDPETVARAEKLVLPGVGAFGDAMSRLRGSGLDQPVIEHIRRDRPFLGICLGLQLLFSTSQEDGPHQGLGVYAGDVVRLEPPPGLKVPHMGWNQLAVRKGGPALAGIPEGASVYFVHSYHVVPRDRSLVATETEYGGPFVSSVAAGRVFACQFHPEKSQRVGLAMLHNFARLE